MSNDTRTPSRTERRRVEYGEGIAWTPPAGTASYLVWTRATPDPAARWQSEGGYDLANDAALTGTATLLSLAATAAGFALPWAKVEELAALGEREAVQVIAYDTAGRATAICRWQVPVTDASDPDVIVAQEREILAVLLEQRKEAADTKGVIQIELPDGTGQKYENIAVIDRRVAEVRARIAWFEAAARGNVMPRAEHW